MTWETIAFAPAPPGWRAQCFDAGERWIEPLAGWLTQENEYTRRVVAAVDDGAGALEPVVEEHNHLLAILGPGQAEHLTPDHPTAPPGVDQTVTA
jgi:hypothetical protein